MRAADIRAWAANHRAAAARERAENRGNPLSASDAFRAAMDLLVWDESLNGSPFERFDPVSRREDEQMWRAWARLRERWPRGG